MTRQSDSNEIDRNSNRGGAARFDRRAFLANAGAAAGALGLGATSVAASETGPETIVPGFACDRRQFTCGRQATAGGGMVSSVDSIASGVAAAVLREGGNAVDAAVALQYVLTVTQPHGSGIGGGGFMVVYDADADAVDVVDSRERAPRGATEDMFLDEDGEPIPFERRIQMGEAVGVPGTVMGLETALARHGSRPRQRLVTPAIELAREGFPIDEVFADQIAENWDKFNEAAKEAYSDENGRPLAAGDTHVNPDLADTLAAIKRGGAAAFYEGPIAADLTATVRGAGGSMTIADLADYDVTIDDPVRAEWRDVEIVGQPLPSSGPSTVAYILKLLEFLDVGRYDIRSPEKYHLLGEATSLAWADRNEYMGDPEFVDAPIAGLLDDGYLRDRAAKISVDDTLADYEAGECVDPGVPPGAEPARAPTPDKEHGSTAHFSVVDADGNAVSYTSTIEQFMGSGMMVPGRGFMLNNELTDFSAVPDGPNSVEPWKRPLSSMSPIIVVRDGVPEFTVGSPGGWTIITSVAQTLLHRYVYGLDPLEALSEPTVFTTDCPPIMWEDGVPARAREATAGAGQVWEDESSGDFGNVQVIEIGDDELVGAADPTRDGLAVGVDRGGVGECGRTD
ncbi:gamma-glutamyltransferase [Natrinema salifodinae]|uniref:Gamma-glutamyltransferase 1 Threonine peptidase. MEROPS family T03 n=1 Tax=Natrinema salifodinae TaxID=1202768 RepID=A0A1I0M1Q0_9EURY|nr:gamma-glutamyltransferase [Natrinema salifodinae]SEV82078.1 gamma-glutamyltransferase 1 Threonine peptidase. MEROPS family T03 [Natrinema salifodinae]